MKNREFYITHDGIQLHAKLDFPDQEKEKYPMLILEHGYTGDMEEPHITGIAKAVTQIGFAVLRIELYGHGKSGGTFAEHTIPKWVSEMLTVIDYARGLEFVEGLYLAGHSQGGLTAMLAGALKRDVLDGLIPLAPAAVIPDNARAGRHFDVSFDPEHIPDMVQLSEDRVLSGNYFRTAQMLPMEEAIRMYTKPVLIVHADTDETVPVSYAYDCAEKYSCARLVIIENDTHCYDHKLPEVIHAVTEFLLETEASREKRS